MALVSVDDQRVDRSAVAVYKLGEEPDEFAYWLSRPAAERFAGIGLLRQAAYGYRVLVPRLLRTLEVVRGPHG